MVRVGRSPTPSKPCLSVLEGIIKGVAVSLDSCLTGSRIRAKNAAHHGRPDPSGSAQVGSGCVGTPAPTQKGEAGVSHEVPP